MTGIVVCILFIKKKLFGCLVILDNLRVYNFRPTSHMLLTVGGPIPVVVLLPDSAHLPYLSDCRWV